MLVKAHIFIILLLSSLVQGQVVNYVNNPSFEDVSVASSTPFDVASYWNPLDSLHCSSYYLMGLPPFGNAPYCSTGFQYPRTGEKFAAAQFFCNVENTNGRFYPSNRLKQVLKPNKIYCAKYYIVNTNNNYIAIENYGVYFGDGSLDTIKKCSYPITYLTPQIEYSGPIITDTLRWIPISGTFVAVGVEKYMVLGNFRTNANTNTLVLHTPTVSLMSADLYIDDVSLIEIDLPAFAGRDTIVHPGDSVFIGRESDIGIDEACIWYKLPDMTNPIDTIAGFWITPTNTATYVVKQQLWCTNTPKWDTVVVQASIYVGYPEFQMLNFKWDIFPNPANVELELKITDQEFKGHFKTICIYNNLGQLLRREEIRRKIDIADFPEGVYLLQLSGSSGTVSKRFMVTR